MFGCSNKRTLFVLGGAVLCAVMLFVGMPMVDYPRSYYLFWDLGHLLCFALWSSLYLRWKPARNYWWQIFWVLTLTFLIGGSTELLQAVFGRTASWSDLGKDLLGSMLALAFWAPSRLLIRRGQLLILQLVLFSLLFWSLIPLVRVVTDELIARQQFPLLSGFEVASETARWGGGSRQTRDSQIAYSGASSLRIDLSTQRYSGVGLRHFPSDWRGYRLLRLHLYNPEAEPLELHFRVHDQLHRQHNNAYSDRFNTSYILPTGWTKLEIPLDKVAAAPKTRPMALDRIAGVGLFVAKLERPRSFNIDEVLLVR